MEKEFNLSEKIGFAHPDDLWTQDVKKFIKLLKEEYIKFRRGELEENFFDLVVDRLAGDKLI